MDIQRFLADIPNLHTWDNGATWNTGGFERFHFEPLHELIAEMLPAGASFIETGAGNSTIFFLLNSPSRVVSIAPDEPLFGRILAHCAGNSISTEPLETRVDCSEWILPEMARANAGTFNFALIDGDHSLERTVIDFFYLNHLLKKGGLLMIDDLGAHAAKEVVRLIRHEPDFTPVLDLRKALVFRKNTDNRTLRAWCDQSYIKQQLDIYGRARDPFQIDQPTSYDFAHYNERDRNESYRAVRRL